MDNNKLKNKIQGLCNKAIDEAETKQEQKELVANLLRVSEFDDENDNKIFDALRQVKRIWFGNISENTSKKRNLRADWKDLHDTVEFLCEDV